MIKCKLITGTAWHPLYISVFNCSHHCCMDRAVHPCPYMTASHAFVKKNRLSPNLFKTTNRSDPLLHILPLARCRVFKSQPAFYYGRVLAIYKRWISGLEGVSSTRSASWIYKRCISDLEGCLRRGPRSVGCQNISIRFWCLWSRSSEIWKKQEENMEIESQMSFSRQIHTFSKRILKTCYARYENYGKMMPENALKS